MCSVAISNNTELIAFKEIDNGYTHAENLHVFIKELLSSTKTTLSDLNAISISSGPGSYTGLRIGFSAAKGLAYALNIPLITIETLKSISYSVLNNSLDNTLFCPLIDARRMEVYCAVYNYELETIMPVQALILNEESINVFNRQQPICFFGDGMPKAKELLQQLPNVTFIENVTFSAKSMIELAYAKFLKNDFEDIAYAEPNYIKDFFFTTSKK
jgi:tRNA threonylcarbamoyladenosine biosynthesis protein TsaB